MNKTLFILFALFTTVSCNQQGSSGTSGENDSTINNNQPYQLETATARDISITSANAYNTLFLDSNAVEDYIIKNKLTENDAADIRNFYNSRNFEFAWFSDDGLTAEVKNFWNAYTYSRIKGQKDANKDKSLATQMDTLLNATGVDSVNTGDASYINAEILITQKFIAYYRDVNNKQKLSQIPIKQLLPAKRSNPLDLADSILKYQPDAGGTDTLRNSYNTLKKQLASWLAIAKQGSWDTIAIKRTLRKGSSSPEVAVIKKRLQLMSYLPGTDTSSLFNDSLEIAIKEYQVSRGLKSDGLITGAVIKDLNIPINVRIGQIIVNMNRMLWLPAELPDNYIQVNIPEFLLRVYQGTAKVFDMKIVAGDEGTKTMMFSGDMNQVVFSPYWNLPVSIVKKEILPAIKRNPGYLRKNKMEIVGKQNNPPAIRQLPGPWNSLGKVKFLFPNGYDIYLHDTNAKNLFNLKNRALSHGCIRLEDAEKMANYILRGESEWTPEKINEAMNSKKELFVKVKQPVPVIITYFTAWVNENGKINFRDDVYGHDKKTTEKLFLNY
jgi:murein L,D-transpeptidase YcbB/YkuD